MREKDAAGGRRRGEKKEGGKEEEEGEKKEEGEKEEGEKERMKATFMVSNSTKYTVHSTQHTPYNTI